jgi:hypothetical protein
MREFALLFADGGGPLAAIVVLAIFASYVVAGWKIFEKAGQPGCGSLIPFYNVNLMCRIAGRPGWWALLIFIPPVFFVIAIIVTLDLARNFGKGTLFAIGLIFLGFIFVPILAYGSSRYRPWGPVP